MNFISGRPLGQPKLSGSTLAPPAAIRRSSVLALAAVQVALLGACATITGDPTQVVHVETLDERGQPIAGMRCHLSNASSEYFGDSPLFELEVHRSSSDLKIACRLGDRVAEGTAVSRSGVRGGVTGVANLMMPGGSAYMVIDHFTGYRYTYPTWVRVQIGQKLVFDAGDDVPGTPVRAVRQEPERPAAPPRAPVIERGLARSDEQQHLLVRSD
jgi:murein DD-endopeptidase MepM/ murein hydrolase activator NlpD